MAAQMPWRNSYAAEQAKCLMMQDSHRLTNSVDAAWHSDEMIESRCPQEKKERLKNLINATGQKRCSPGHTVNDTINEDWINDVPSKFDSKETSSKQEIPTTDSDSGTTARKPRQLQETDDDGYYGELFWKKDALEQWTKEQSQHTSSSTTLLVLPDTLPTTTEEIYTEVIQNTLADGINLKPAMKLKLKSVKGVESVSLGFSSVRDGYWPVVKVFPDKETCERIKDKETDSFLTDELALALREALNNCYSKSWSLKELKSIIEVTLNYPLESVPLCTAGAEITTKYTSKVTAEQANTHRRADCMITGKTTCNILHELNVGGEDHHAHYIVTGLHVVAPSHHQTLQKFLPQLPTSSVRAIPSAVKYEYLTQNTFSQLALVESEVTNTSDELDDELPAIRYMYSLPILLAASIFPTDYINMLKTIDDYRLTLRITNQSNRESKKQANFVMGKMGLFKHTNEVHEYPNAQRISIPVYRHVIVNDAAHQHEDNTIARHPCNIDIAVLQLDSSEDEYVCSIAESLNPTRAEGIDLPVKIQWMGPPELTLRNMKGAVVYVTGGVVYKLSHKLSAFADELNQFEEEYPFCIWEPAPGVSVPPGHSGSPVFLVKDDAFKLIGNLITKKNASLIHFSLKLIASELALHHTEQVIDELERKQTDLEIQQKQDRASALEIKINILKAYKAEYLQPHKDMQSLKPLQPRTYSELLHSPVQDDRTITSNIEICMNPH